MSGSEAMSSEMDDDQLEDHTRRVRVLSRQFAFAVQKLIARTVTSSTAYDASRATGAQSETTDADERNFLR